MTPGKLLFVVLAGLGLGFGGGPAALGADTTTGSIQDGYLGGYYVGYTADGTLSLDRGSQRRDYYSYYLGYNAACNGTATVTGTPSSLTFTGNLYSGFNGRGTLNVLSGGLVNLTYGSVYLAYKAGSLGAATVSGAGSKLTISTELDLGYSDNATLRVDTGGLVSDYRAYLGYNSGATGAATITGSGSMWTTSYDLYVGWSGTGALTVSDGGVVSAYTLWAPINSLLGNGTINANGAVMDGDVAFDSAHFLTPKLSFGTGGTVNLGLNAGSQLGAGYKGTGTLRIADGAAFTSAYGYVGYYAGSSGTATVSGAGSSWTNSTQLVVGNYGSGTLNIQAGATFGSPNAYLGYFSGSAGTITVTGTGSSWAFHTISDFYVGYSGSGTLNVEAGAQVITNPVYLGYKAGATGTIKVAGTGSLLSAGGSAMEVGYNGAGVLNIQEGGQVISGGGAIGVYSGSSGTVTVTGAGSKWTNGGYLEVAAYGGGSLSIQAGGQVSNTWASIGTGGTGTTTVDGAGSTWTSSGELRVGETTNGTLNIQRGAQVKSAGTGIGYYAGSRGAVTVTGAGSALTNSYDLYVGKSGSGTLTVADGGKVTAMSATVGTSSSAVRLKVSGNDMLVLGSAATAGGVSNGGTISFYADAFLPANAYTPISELQGRAITWSGTGSYKAVGGTWNTSAKAFTPTALTALAAGLTDTVLTGERLLVTDPGSGKRLGASFGSVAAGTHFSATLMGGSELDALRAMAGFEGTVRSAWVFDTNFSGETLLAFDIGPGVTDLAVWHFDGSAWAPFATDMLTYDATSGIVDFNVTSFSGYAVSGVPEPATLTLLGLGSLAMLGRRRRSR